MTKRQSSVLYGIAILMMLYHHTFCSPDIRFNVGYFSVLGIFGIERKLAWFCKICVGIYAFISGYGICKCIKHISGPEKGITNYLCNIYSNSCQRIFRFMKKYWLVCIIFVPIGYIMHVFQFDVLDLIKVLLALSAKYNGEWWYVKQYIFMVLAVPCLDLFFRIVTYSDNKKLSIIKSEIFLLIFTTIIFYLLFGFSKQALVYFIIFILGFITARFYIIEKITLIFENGGGSKTIIGLLVMLFCLTMRISIAHSAGHMLSDLVGAPLFVISFCLITQANGRVWQIFNIFGKYSLYMWLTHSFYLYIYTNVQPIVIYSRISTLMYLTLIILSLLTAIILSWFETNISKILPNKHYFRKH